MIQYLGYDYLECELDTVTLQCFPDLTTSAKIDKESIQHFLSTIQQVTTSIVLFIEYFQRSIVCCIIEYSYCILYVLSNLVYNFSFHIYVKKRVKSFNVYQKKIL